MGYNKHQTFYLRINWIAKVINSYEGLAEDFFIKTDENFKDFGLGKVMFKSLRYWLEATCIFRTEKVYENSRHIRTIHQPTCFAEFISLKDRHAKSKITKILVHYFLVSKDKINNVDYDHVYYWVFNVCSENIFDKQSLLSQILEWDSKASKRQILSDIDNLLLTYTKPLPNSPEDLIVSYLSSLKLIKFQNGFYYKTPLERMMYNFDAFFFILLRWKERGENLSIDSLCYDEGSIGKIFNFNKLQIIEIIESLINTNYPLEIDRTNNLNTIRINYIDTSFNFLLGLEIGKIL